MCILVVLKFMHIITIVINAYVVYAKMHFILVNFIF